MSPPFVHQSADVDEGAVLSADVRVWHYCHIMPGASIGEGTSLGQNCFVGRDVRIGARCRLQNNVSVYEGVTLEDGVFCGPSAVFTNDLTPRALMPKNGAYIPTLVRYGASIGANATIICGITIGEHAMIAAGAVVTTDVPPFALMVGAPARRAGWVCVCGLTLSVINEAPRCSCGRAYRVNEHGVTMEPE